MKLKKGDPIVVITGANKGQRGSVLKVLGEKNKVIVEGVNLKTKHQKPTQENPNGGIEKIEAPIHISNVAYYDEESGKQSRIRIEKNDQGARVRVLTRSNTTLSN